MANYSLVNSYTNDVFFIYGAEAVGFARNMNTLAGMYENKLNAETSNPESASAHSTLRNKIVQVILPMSLLSVRAGTKRVIYASYPKDKKV